MQGTTTLASFMVGIVTYDFFIQMQIQLERHYQPYRQTKSATRRKEDDVIVCVHTYTILSFHCRLHDHVDRMACQFLYKSMKKY